MQNIDNETDALSVDENIRLFLQYCSDQTTNIGYPTALEGAPERAERLGLIERTTPSGWVQYRLTEIGTKVLKEANAGLGNKATRFVHEVKYFGSLEPVVYGYPFLWPLSAPVRRIGGSLVVDRRNPIVRFFVA